MIMSRDINKISMLSNMFNSQDLSTVLTIDGAVLDPNFQFKGQTQ